MILNLKKNMLIANDKIITSDVDSWKYNNKTHKYDITFKNGAIYHYNYTNVELLKDPQVLNPVLYKISRDGREFFGITALYLFSSSFRKYLHICFENGTERDYNVAELNIAKSCLCDSDSKNVFTYLKQIANFNELKADDGTKLLQKQYEKLSFIENDTALAAYLNPNIYHNNNSEPVIPIFPFGCNASQFKAVKSALENQISVVEGPPGTGKTQTILNIIANLLIAGKTVQIVSNNNTATENILEKLSSSKYDMGFFVAPLGNSKNKAEFINKQTGIYPDISSWKNESFDEISSLSEVKDLSIKLNNIFDMQEHLALTKQELQALETEQKYFEEYSNITDLNIRDITLKKRLSSEKLMSLWQNCQITFEQNKKISFIFRLKSKFIYGISDWHFYERNINEIIIIFQKLYYHFKHDELMDEITSLQKELSSVNAADEISKFADISMRFFKNCLYKKYGNKVQRNIFSEDDFNKIPTVIQEEYPVVLSSTFSARSSLHKNASFDYLIMDEASQVDVATGALALSCSKNAVIVGDTKQLPNIVTEDQKNLADEIFNSFRIRNSYNYAHNSFLKSISDLMPNIPHTLLKEHYRCHPKIINFCNQKFYEGNLVIMTEDHGESDVLSVIKTVQGNHARGRMNQRQIDVLCEEILPKLSVSDNEIGVIAPYNDQVDALITALNNPSIDVATVHKFQGREKDTVILTTVDNEITDFTDDPYLLNVAVSRAKKQLCLVVSGNEQPADSNIGDLISYIEYHNFTVAESKLHSVFDYLYEHYTESRFAYLKKHRRISEYDSENLMYALICDTLREQGYIELGVICHQPLNLLISNTDLLNYEERKYAMNPTTHIDFLIYNRITKKPVLAVEADGFYFHKDGTVQSERDKMKNHILNLYGMPYLRFSTNGSGEKEKLTQALNDILKN